MDHDLTLLHTGIDFGEGPRWHNGMLWFSDFFRHGVFTLADGVETRIATVEGQPSGLGWMPDGTLLIVSMIDRRVLRLDASGELHEHADLSELATWHCNDMVVAADGTAYVGNFGFDLENEATPEAAGVVRITPHGDASVAADGLMFPNGAVITPDGLTLIVGETFGGQYTAFTIAADGSLTDRRVWAQMPGFAPDGCCLDEVGGIWFADPVNNQVVRVEEGGEITDTIALEHRAFACALGDDDRKTLFILSGPGSTHDEMAGKGLSTIHTTRVAAAGAGLP